MIWEPFLLALVLGLIVSAGIYFAYLWPSVEPVEDDPAPATAPTAAPTASEAPPEVAAREEAAPEGAAAT